MALCDGSELWDIDLFWNADVPRLSSCLQSVLILAPNLLFCFIFILQIGQVYFRKDYEAPSPNYPITVLYVTKLCVSVLLIVCSLLKFIYASFFQNETSTRITAYAEVAQIVAYVLVMSFQMYHRRIGLLNSPLVFSFWLASSLCGFMVSPIFLLITGALNEKSDNYDFLLDSMTYPMLLIQLVLATFTDPAYDSVFTHKKDTKLIEHQPIISRLLFSWINRLMKFGYHNTIDTDDLDQMELKLRSAYVYQELMKYLKPNQSGIAGKNDIKTNKEIKKKSSPLFWAVAKALMPYLLVAAVLEILYDFITLVPPLILDSLIDFVGNPDEIQWHGFVYAGGLFLAEVARTFLMTHDLHYLVLASLVPRLGLTAAIYRKSLKLSGTSKREYTLGELCNLVTVDAQKVFELLWTVNLIWSAPLRITLTIILLWQYLGIACLAGIAAMILVMPVTAYLSSKAHRLQEKQMKRKDYRLRQMGEILNGIKILKLFAWEIPFTQRISSIRDAEVATIKKMAMLNAVILFQWGIAPFLVAISSFVAFILMDESNVLDANVAFVSLTLFNSLNSTFDMIPDLITDVIQSRVSFRRLEKFLEAEELDDGIIGHDVRKGDAISIDGGCLSWSEGAEDPFLRDVTLSVAEGGLVAVVGRVGSGKSALLSAVLGEMHLTRGSINVMQGNVAYVAQQPWIQNATMQDNILFLRRMEVSHYLDVLDRCCLKRDLEVLPAGDQTEIGEKGVNLSGGQKQRVSLARALYQDADIYLLDDPLSAVDAHVGAHIFERVIGPNGTLRNKTRLWVTNDLSLLPEVDTVFVVSDGKIVESGSYEELVQKEGDSAILSKLIEEHRKSLQDTDNDFTASEIPDSPDVEIPADVLKDQMKRAGSTISRSISTQDLPIASNKRESLKLIEKEKMEMGGVKASVFLSYFRHASYYYIALMLLSFAAYQTFQVYSNIWLSEWSNDAALGRGQNIKLRNLRIIVYGLLGLGQALFILSAAMLLAFASTRASRRLHTFMLDSIMRSPLSFFERTPVGRILNRFGKDVNVLDTNIPWALDNLVTNLLGVIGTVVVISYSNPIFMAIIISIAVVYILVQSFYLATSRQVRRIQSVTLSPVMSNLSETVQGSSTIRAFGAERAFIAKEDQLVDYNTRSFFCSTVLNRWLSLRLELMGSLIVLSVALFSVFGRHTMNPGLVGLTLSYALKVTVNLARIVKLYTTLEIRMVSVERLDEYSELQPEAAWNIGKEITGWPNAGQVSFKDYKLRYQKSDNYALNGINVNIKPCEKVGIVGRTGAGKSSLTVALFRTVEAAGGSIDIDGIDIATLGLHDLRSKLTSIPQDPVLFSGTIRLNLDPFSIHNDDELWGALDHSHLKNFVIGLDLGLDYDIAEGGENISVGQSQQLCLARALLKKTKILVLDEATAAVDMETDRLIQDSIRKEFQDCTVITIAHRLYTILDYDRILVMDDGKVVEDGKPDYLLQKVDSKFYKLAKDAGLL